MGSDSRDNLARPSDELGDRRDRLRPPGRRGRERKAVLEAGASHAAREGALVRPGKEGGLARIGDRARAERARIGDRSGFIEFRRLAVEARKQGRLPDLPDGIDVAALPRDLSRRARVIAGDAVQHAFARKISVDGRVSDLRLADVIEVIGGVEGLQAGRLERGVGLVDVGDVGVDGQFASESVGAVGGDIDHTVVVEDRRDGDRQRAIVVVHRRALEMIGAEVKVTLRALAAQIRRRDDVLEKEIVEVDALKPVIVEEEFVAHPCAVPAELPHVIEKKVPGALERAAQAQISRAIGKGGEGARLLLVDPDRPNVVHAVG